MGPVRRTLQGLKNAGRSIIQNASGRKSTIQNLLIEPLWTSDPVYLPRAARNHAILKLVNLLLGLKWSLWFRLM